MILNIVCRRGGERTITRSMWIESKETYLKTGHDTPVTPPVPPIAKSSALPLKSLITFPVLTSKIYITTL
jgi:hypothetical protein